MRPQQNRRMRGRGGNNNNNNSNNSGRKGPNPLTRSYESNGPDVKIRGSAQQIAEKYTTLARDAQSAGDRVVAENYLQHAEHYNRIIMAAQAQMPQPQIRDNRDDDDLDEDGEDSVNTQASASEQQQAQPQQQVQPQQQPNGMGPQPVIEGVPAEVLFKQDAAEQAPATEQGAAESVAKPRTRARAKPVATEEGETAEQEVAARKPRRPRRPRVKAEEEGAAQSDEQPAASDEPITEAAQ